MIYKKGVADMRKAMHLKGFVAMPAPAERTPNPEKQQAVDFGLKEWYDDKAGVYNMPLDVFQNDESVRNKVLDLLAHGKLYKRADDDSTRWGLWEEDNLHHYSMDVYDMGDDGVWVAIASNDY